MPSVPLRRRWLDANVEDFMNRFHGQREAVAPARYTNRTSTLKMLGSADLEPQLNIKGRIEAGQFTNSKFDAVWGTWSGLRPGHLVAVFSLARYRSAKSRNCQNLCSAHRPLLVKVAVSVDDRNGAPCCPAAADPISAIPVPVVPSYKWTSASISVACPTSFGNWVDATYESVGARYEKTYVFIPGQGCRCTLSAVDSNHR